MIFYNISSGTVNFFNDDKSIGRVSIPEIKSNLFKEVYIKTVIFLVTSNFKKYTGITLPSSKIAMSTSDITAIDEFRDILNFSKLNIVSDSVMNSDDSIKYLGGSGKDPSKHVVFFSGGKESWYKILYLTKLLNVNQEDILVIYINKWNGTCGKEAKAIVSLNKKFPKINIKVIDISISIKKKHAYSLEYLVMIAASLEKVMAFNGGSNIHFGFSNIQWVKGDTYIDSFSETIEAEEMYFKYLSTYNIHLDRIQRLEIEEYLLYDYELFKENNVIDDLASCIVPDGLSTLSRNKFIEKFPELSKYADDKMCCYCTKCILKIMNKIKFDEDNLISKDTMKKFINKSIDNKLIPIQKGNKETQFIDYDLHLLSYLYSLFSDYIKKIS